MSISINRVLATLSLIVGTLLVFYITVSFPKHNWDLIPYVASAISLNNGDIEVVHVQAYEDVRDNVDQTSYAKLITGDFREAVNSSPDSLRQLLPLYKIKFGYIYLIEKFHGIFGSYTSAAHAISYIFCLLCIPVIYVLISDLKVPVYFSPIIIFGSGIVLLGRYATPDSGGLFFGVLAYLFFLRGMNKSLGFALALSMTFRPDMIVLACVFFVVGLKRYSYKSFFSIMLLPLLCWLFIRYSYQSYGHLEFFNISLIHGTPYPELMKISTRAYDYIRPYMHGVVYMLLSPYSILYLLVFVMFYKIKKFYSENFLSLNQKVVEIVSITTIYFFIRFLLYPNYDERYFVICILVYSISLVSMLYNNRDATKSESF